MSSAAATINLVNNVTDPLHLLSLIPDDLMSNYRSYIKPEVITSSYDYSTLRNKIAYDSYTNTSTPSTTGSINSVTMRTKKIMTYVKQYHLDKEGRKIYSYRLIEIDTPVVAASNATSVIPPARFTTDVESIDETHTVHYIETSVRDVYQATSREDFLNMPVAFADLRLSFSPDPSATYFALRSMLINYYGEGISITTSNTARVLSAIGLVLGSLSIVASKSWSSLSLFIILGILPVIITFFSPVYADTIDQQKIDRALSMNSYQILSGAIGSVLSFGTILYSIM